MLVTDRRSASVPLPDLATRAIAGGVDLIQIREKDLAAPELRSLAIEVLDAVGDRRRVTINGVPEIARELEIGLHLPEMLVSGAEADVHPLSRSVHSADTAGESGWVDFVVVGHVHPTRSKTGLQPLGLEGLAQIVTAAPVPVIAIGGISPERVRCILAAGAFGVAVQSAINDSADPEAAAWKFRQALENAMTEQTTSMTVMVNGKQADLPPGITVLDYLKERGHHDRLVVVELNGQILAKSTFATTSLSAGDRIEIVHFVGGG
jgi:thiamine biosynthesis protein ThiS